MQILQSESINDRSGQASLVPHQARFDGEAKEATANLSKGSCVKCYPTQVRPPPYLTPGQ